MYAHFTDEESKAREGKATVQSQQSHRGQSDSGACHPVWCITGAPPVSFSLLSAFCFDEAGGRGLTPRDAQAPPDEAEALYLRTDPPGHQVVEPASATPPEAHEADAL